MDKPDLRRSALGEGAQGRNDEMVKWRMSKWTVKTTCLEVIRDNFRDLVSEFKSGGPIMRYDNTRGRLAADPDPFVELGQDGATPGGRVNEREILGPESCIKCWLERPTLQ